MTADAPRPVKPRGAVSQSEASTAPGGVNRGREGNSQNSKHPYIPIDPEEQVFEEKSPGLSLSTSTYFVRTYTEPTEKKSYLLPPVTKFRGVFGGRKLFLPGHSGLIFDGRVETAITSRTPHPSATRVANKNSGSRSCTARPAPPRRPPTS